MGALSLTSLGNPSNNLTCERQSCLGAAAFAFVVVLELQVASSAAEPVHVSVVAMATLDRHAWESSRNANAERARMTGSEKNDAFCNAARRACRLPARQTFGFWHAMPKQGGRERERERELFEVQELKIRRYLAFVLSNHVIIGVEFQRGW